MACNHTDTDKGCVLFLLGSFTMGGIQSNISRLIPFLIRRGLRVKILLITDKVEPSFLAELQGAEVIFYRDYIPFRGVVNSSALLHSIGYVSSRLKRKLAKVECIHAVDSETMMLGTVLSRRLDVSINVGCYHPREFTWQAGSFYFRQVQQEIYSTLSYDSRNFFNDEVLHETRSFFAGGQVFGEVIPLGINIPQRVSEGYDSNRIVSIGRLVSFKAYNEHMILMLDGLNRKYNRNFEYHIYGDGPNMKHLVDLASSVESKVYFHGVLPYSQFYDVLNDTFLFVGCGSALLEAAAAGVPCLYGVDSIERPFTYGYFHNVPGTNLGEVDSSLDLLSYDEVFEDILGFQGKSKYRSISVKEVDKAASFSLDSVSEKWINCFKKSKKTDVSFSLIRYMVSNVIWLGLNFFRVRNDRSSRY